MIENVHLHGILLAYAVLVMGICSPGPAVLAIIGTALEKGRRPASFLAMGVVCGSIFWGIAAAAGLSALLTHYGSALVIMKIVGGLYLLWLAYKSLRAATNDAPQTAKPGAVNARGNGRMWLTGLLIHLTNPKAVFAWLATIALGMTPTSPAWVAIAIVGGGAVISTLGNLGYAMLFSTDRASRIYARSRRGIQFAFAAVFGAAGLRLLMARA